MNVRLRDIRNCFEGVIPSIIATTDPDGIPNISYLSQVFYVDDTRIALSNQFFSKTAANVRATRRATVLVVDGWSGVQYLLDTIFERAIGDGELFERMAAHLKAISSQHGMDAVMALRSADVYRVLGCRAVPSPGAEASPSPPALSADHLAAAAQVVAAIGAEADADGMIDRVLEGVTAQLGFRNAMVLVPDGGDRLTTLASRGYEPAGVGSEVRLGEGVIGIAAASHRPVRISDMSRGHRFAAAVHATTPYDDKRTIRLPGLTSPKSQLAVPMLSQGRLRGVLFLESEARFAFTREDEEALSIIAGQLAASLRLLELEAREASSGGPRGRRVRCGPGAPVAFRVRYFRYDDSIFIDDAYIIKGVPGRLLYYFLRLFVEEGRNDFTNREIRRDRSLRLPDLKDNLETRLLLLRRRLDERGAPVRILRPERGHIHLDLRGIPIIDVITEEAGQPGNSGGRSVP